MANQSSYRSKQFHIVIEEKDILNDKNINEITLNNCLKNEMRIDFYAFIKHDNDLDDDGNQKHVHYHVVVSLNQSYSKNTIINAIAGGLDCNRDIISVRKIKSFVLSIQYLLHKNDKDKYQYEYLDIWTNDINEVNMCLYENTCSYDLDLSYLIELCRKSNCIADIYSALGLQKSKMYRSLIMDIYREEHIERFI